VPGAVRAVEAPDALRGLIHLGKGRNRVMRSILRKSWRAPSMAAAGCLVLGLALASGSQPAAAQGTPAQRAACERDAYRLCNEFVPDERTTAACLRRHRMSLSPACRAVFSGRGARKARGHRRY